MIKKTILVALTCLAVSFSSSLSSFATDKLIKMKIDGMTCENCSSMITKKVSALAGVKFVKVDLEKGIAIVTPKADAKIDQATLKQTVEKLGYTVTSIE